MVTFAPRGPTDVLIPDLLKFNETPGDRAQAERDKCGE
jgi:hypothetical protein